MEPKANQTPFRFDESLRERWRHADGLWRFEVPTGWMQGRSVFGGLVAAAAVALGHRFVQPPRVLRTFHATLMRPVVAGIIEGTCEILRGGSNVTFAAIALQQSGKVVATFHLVFTAPRPGGVTMPAAPVWTHPSSPGQLADLPYIPGIVPEFVQHLSLRIAEGGIPFSGEAQPLLRGYCRLHEPSGEVEGVLALLDAWWCPSLSALSKPAPASTVTWTAHFLIAPQPSDQWFSFEYETVVGQDGYHSVVGRLHDADGRLVARTEQLAALFQ